MGIKGELTGQFTTSKSQLTLERQSLAKFRRPQMPDAEHDDIYSKKMQTFTHTHPHKLKFYYLFCDTRSTCFRDCFSQST